MRGLTGAQTRGQTRPPTTRTEFAAYQHHPFTASIGRVWCVSSWMTPEAAPRCVQSDQELGGAGWDGGRDRTATGDRAALDRRHRGGESFDVGDVDPLLAQHDLVSDHTQLTIGLLVEVGALDPGNQHQADEPQHNQHPEHRTEVTHEQCDQQHCARREDVEAQELLTPRALRLPVDLP